MTTQEPRDGRSAPAPPGAPSQDEDTTGVSVDLVFWAGARTVAGAAEERVRARSVAEALRGAAARRSDPRFDRLLAVCTVLVGGVVQHPADLEAPLTGPVRAEILPPFAGGRSAPAGERRASRG